MNESGELLCDDRILTSSPRSSGTLSSEFTDNVPTSLATKELDLALDKEATEEELNKAIYRCKNLVLDSPECSVERKWLVRHLIELRLRLQEIKEAMNDPQHPRNTSSGVSKRTVRGHHLNLQPLLRNAIARYCDHCTGKIWSVVQAWYECEDCGYSCHHKCLSLIVRECAHVIVTERGTYEYDICPEIGLSAQKYQCAECKASLQVNNTWSEAKRCDYTGLYYCAACHWNSLAVVPARVIHNWDFSPQPVCQASLQQLRITSNRPLINLEELNPKLFSLVHELNLVRRLRQEVMGMKKYLMVCRKADEDHVLWQKIDTHHLIDSINIYSLQDLMDVSTGELLTKLHSMIDTFSNHIKIDCEICQARGHICEICSNDEVLYPFDGSAYTCGSCSSVMHKACYSRKSVCPKCIRIKHRLEEEMNNNKDDFDDKSD